MPAHLDPGLAAFVAEARRLTRPALPWCLHQSRHEKCVVTEDTGAGICVDGPHRTSGLAEILLADLEINLAFATLSTGAVVRMGSVQP